MKKIILYLLMTFSVYALTETECLEILSKNPNDSDTILALARIYNKSNVGKSLSYYRKYFELNGYENSEIIFEAGNAFFKCNLFESANDIFSKDKNEYYKNLFGVAVTSRFLGFYQKSIEYYKKYINVRPKDKEGYIGIGIAYQLNGNYSEAINYFKKYIEFERKEEVYTIIAILFIKMGKIENAKEILEEASYYFPDSVEIKNLITETYKN